MTAYNNDKQESSGNFSPQSHSETSEKRGAPALIEKFVIRLPKGLRNKIKHLSEKNRRSMNSEIIMVLENHIQQNMTDDQAAAFLNDAISQSEQSDSMDIHRPSDSELSRRLENLPEEKKQALLELLG